MGADMGDISLEMESQKDKGIEGNKMKEMAIKIEKGLKNNMQMVEQTLMEIDNQKEDLSVEEQVMKRLL